MNISSYGGSYNYSGYGVLLNKAKTSAVSTAIPEQKPKSTNRNSVSNTGSDPFKDMAATGNVNFPSWIYTKTELTRSEDEIKKDIIELAKKHAKNGTSQLRDYEFESLMKEWTSPASPDRESILKNRVSEMNRDVEISNLHKNKEKKGDLDKTNNFDQISKLLEILEGIEKGKVVSGSSGTRASTSASDGSNGGQVIFNMMGVNYDAHVNEKGEIKFASIKDSNGYEVIAFDDRNSSRQLSITMNWTEKEGLRCSELLKVYNEAYKEEVNSKGSVSGNFINETA